jgi:excisionase family DNA binding protein
MPGDLISARDAAERLGISHSQVTRLCGNGTLKHQRIGNALCIEVSSLEDVAARRKVGRPKVWKFGPLIKELRKRGHESLAAKIEKIFSTE